MATGRVITQTPIPGSYVATWTGLLNGESGVAADLPVDAATRSVQVSGTFGVGGNVIIEGSNDGTNFFALNNALGTALATITAAALNSLDQNCLFLRPRVSAGDGTTSITVIIVCV